MITTVTFGWNELWPVTWTGQLFALTCKAQKKEKRKCMKK